MKQHSANTHFLALVASMYLSKWTRPYSAKVWHALHICFHTPWLLAATSSSSPPIHLDLSRLFGELRPPVGISDLPTESGQLVLSPDSTVCFCCKIHQDSSRFWVRQCWTTFGGSYETITRWCLATGALSGNLWPKTGWVPSNDSDIAAFYKTHRCCILVWKFDLSESCRGLDPGRKRSRFSMPLHPLRWEHSRHRKPQHVWSFDDTKTM